MSALPDLIEDPLMDGPDHPLGNVRECDASAIADPETFRTEIASACLPVVIRGACSSWPSVAAARESTAQLDVYIRRFVTDQLAEAFRGDPTIGGRYFYGEGNIGFNFEKIRISIADALAEILASAEEPSRPSVYFGSLRTDIYLPGFAAENFLPMLQQLVSPRIWIGNASHIACHYDSLDNIACVVAGRRRFTLYPPEAIADLYVGPIDHTMAGQPVSMAASAPEGGDAYPRFPAARARAMTAELFPGDALYLPKLWWHEVNATEPFNILVNYWWDAFAAGPDSPIWAMMLAMIGIAERPAAERAAFKAFFDHYVFREQGHPLAHLPENQHGILGPLANGNYGRIRAIIMRHLRS